MPSPNTFEQNLRQEIRKQTNRRAERKAVDEADLDHARDNWNLDSYNEFFADCRSEDIRTQRCGAIWSLLKERGDAPTGSSGAAESGDDMGTSNRQPASPSPETVEELEQEFRAADQVYLITTDGCPDCNAAKEALSDWIDEGVVQVENIQRSDLAADIVIETNLEAVPALVMEKDGNRAIV